MLIDNGIVVLKLEEGENLRMDYYNDNDKKACSWLESLIVDGLIPPGRVDSRSITEVKPDELREYEQCHFFAGIGGWSRAIELAGWRGSIWSASLPCQPFSCAGKGKGLEDERHLFPVFLELVRECKPDIIVGEQVPAAIGKGWLDGVFDALGSEGYTCGAIVLPACSIGAPHLRQRLFWVAHSEELHRGRSNDHSRSDTEMLPEIPQLRDSNNESILSGLSEHWRSIWHYCRDGKWRRIPARRVDDPHNGRDEQIGRSEREEEGVSEEHREEVLCGGGAGRAGRPGRVGKSNSTGFETREPLIIGEAKGSEPTPQSSISDADGRVADPESQQHGAGESGPGGGRESTDKGAGGGEADQTQVKSGIFSVVTRLPEGVVPGGGEGVRKEVAGWVTPRANAFASRPNKKGGITPEEQANLAGWQSPKASDCKSPGKSRDVHLKHQAEMTGEVPLEADPDLFPLSEGVPGRVALLKGAGNSIVPEVAAVFLKAVMEM